MKNVIFIGSIYPQGMQDVLLKQKSVVDFAGHTFQTALLNGLDHYYSEIKVISSALTSSYPKVNIINFECQQFSHKGMVQKQDVYVGAINIPLLKLYSKFRRVKSELKKSLKPDDENIVIVYAPHSPFLLAAYKLRKYISKLCVVVPDLPEFMGAKPTGIRAILKDLDKKLINKCLSKFDGFVLLSPYMREKLHVGNKPWLQFEGIYQVPASQNEDVTKEENRTIMYAGNIYRKRGVDMLLEAFSKIDKPNYRLWIRGNGEMKQEIIELSKKDPRIIYFEPMKREELLQLERRATLMVNPTPASWEFTKYFFPSKNMEFMASGTPTLMFKLACLPEEYHQYLFFAEESVEALRDKILEICEKPQEELDAFGKKASDFICHQKNAVVQAGRLVEFINNL